MARAKQKPIKIADVRNASIDFLTKKQNKDGGWGEFDSNPMCTTMASYSLFRLGKFEAANKGLQWNSQKT